MTTFFLAMVLYPDVQKKAQAEIDRVVGKDRLPDFTDRNDLPYVDALLRELLRWHPPIPTGEMTCVSVFPGLKRFSFPNLDQG